MNYRENTRRLDEENYPLNINYTVKREKKYSYQQPELIRSSNCSGN